LSDTPVEPDDLLDDPADYQDESEADTGDLPLIDDLLATQPDLSDIEFEEGEEAPEDADPALGVGPGGTIVEPTPGPLEPVSSWSAADEDGTYEELAAADEAPVDEPEDDVTVLLEINEEDENEPEDSGPTWAKYEVQGRDRDETVEWQTLATEDYGQDAEAEIEGLRTGIRMEFRVRLISTDNIASEWSTLFYYTLPSDLTPPPAPTPPTASDNSGFITHTHDGELTGPVPADMSHRVLYAQQMHPVGNSAGEPGDPVRIAQFPAIGAAVITTGQYVDRVLHRAWMIAVDTTGNESDRSEYVEFTPTEPVDAQRIREELEEINGEGGRLPQLEKSLSMGLDDFYKQLSDQKGTVSTIQKAVIDNAASAQEEYDRLEGVAQRALAAAGNLAKDGGFDDPTLEHWPLGSTSSYWSATGGRTSPSAYAVPTGTVNNHYPRTTTYPVTPGDVYYMEAYYKIDAAPGSARVGPIAAFYGADTFTNWFALVPADTVLAANEYRRVSGYLTVPPGSTSAYFGPWVERGQTGTVFIDDVKIANVTENAAALQAAEAARVAAEAAQAKAGQAELTAQTALTAANSKSRIYSSTSAPSGTADNGSLWYRWSSTASTRRLLGIWVRESGSWASMGTLDATLIPLLDIGAGTFGQLSGDRLRAKSVLAEALMLQSGNLVSNPDFSQNAAGWGTGRQIAQGFGPAGENALVIPGSNAVTGAYLGVLGSETGYRIPVKPGESYRLSVRVRPSGSGAVASPPDNVRLYARLYRGAGDWIWATPDRVSNTSTIPAQEWSTVEGLIKVPAGSEYTNLVLGLYSGPATTTDLYFISPQVVQANGASMYVQGSIGAVAIDVQNLAADISKMNQLWAGIANIAEAHIVNLYANSGKFKTIEGASIVGSTYQTATSIYGSSKGGVRISGDAVNGGTIDVTDINASRVFRAGAGGVFIAGDIDLSGSIRVGGNGEGGIIPDGSRTRFTGRTPATTGSTDTMAYGRTGKLTVPTSRTRLTVTYESPTPYDARVPMVSVHRETNQMTAVWAHTQARTSSSFQVLVNASAGATFWIYYTAWWGDPPDSPGSVEAS